MILRPVGQGAPLHVILTRLRWDVELIGPKNGVNCVFTTPDIFIQDGQSIIRVHLNGQRLLEGAARDYVASEGGGSGTGYNTITLAVAPKSYECLTADYITP